MGGVDKGLQLINGRPMVQHVLQRLQPQVGKVLINANRHLDEYQRLGLPVCVDIVSGYAGPLSGIHAGLMQTSTPYLLSVPCDSPRIPLDLVSRLSTEMSGQQANAAVVVTGNEVQRQRHPVFLLLKTELQRSLEQYLESGRREVDDWLAGILCVEVMFEDETAFMNLNTPEDIQALTRITGSRPAPG